MKKIIIIFSLYLDFITPIFAMPAIPTFDYSNLVNAIDSTYKAVMFYNSAISQTQKYIDLMEDFSKALEKQDINGIMKGIENTLSGIRDITKLINDISDRIREARRKAEIKSKKSTLEILKYLSDPDMRNLKSFLDERYKNKISAREKITSIGKDTIEALKIVLKDHSESADAAIEELDSKTVSLLRKISDNIKLLNEKYTSTSNSLTANTTLNNFQEQILSANDSAIILLGQITALKKEINDTTEYLENEIETWQRITNKTEESIRLEKEIDKSNEILTTQIDKLYKGW